MTDLIIPGAALTLLLLAARKAYRQAKVREALDERRVFHVSLADVPDAHEAVSAGLHWTWDQPCHVCAARLTTAAHYIGGGRACCEQCYDAMLKARGAA